MNKIAEDANTVLFPAFEGLSLPDSMARFMDEGGISMLLAESREEYVARKMTSERIAFEKTEMFRNLIEDARARTDFLLTGVDQEPGGIRRLEAFTSDAEQRCNVEELSEDEIYALGRNYASIAKSMGINMFISPVLDTLTGENVWLAGRTMSGDPGIVSRLASQFINGVQKNGVATVAKHFPGFRQTTGDPAINSSAISPVSIHDIRAGLAPFSAAVAAGVAMMMVGPCPVPAIDADYPALCSPGVIKLLRKDLGFRGVVLSDDLDAAATMRNKPVTEVAVSALIAGCDMLLLADNGDNLQQVHQAILNAVYDGRLERDRLSESAEMIRRTAAQYCL